MNVFPFDPADAFPLTLGLRLAVIAGTLALSGRTVAARRVAFVGSAIASVGTGLLAGNVLHTGAGVDGRLFLHQASGLALGYRVDGLSAWFLLVLAVLAVPIAVYSLGYLAHPHLRRRSVFVGVVFNLLVGAVEIVFAADDVITFLFAWELMTLATAALVIDRTRRASQPPRGLPLPGDVSPWRPAA